MTALVEPAATSRKGKEKENESHSSSSSHWSLSWEHVQALVSNNRHALAWLNNNLVLTPHASQARLCARFVHPTPSSPPTTFEFPDPQVDLTPYGPPALIYAHQASFKDCWVYAYFPPATAMLSSGDGLACVWDCQPVVGEVSVVSWWLVKKGNAPVCGRWIGQMRDWFISPDKKEPQRERPLGPVPAKGPILLLVTESNSIEVVHRSERPPHQFSVVRASLHSASMSLASDPLSEDSAVGPSGARLCTKAAIGLGSDSESIVVATVSRLAPYAGPSTSPVDAFDITGDLGIPSAAGPSSKGGDYHPSLEEWGEDRIISLCEVRINTGADPIVLETYPLFPIDLHWSNDGLPPPESPNNDVPPTRQLLHLEFTNLVPPATDKKAEPGKSEDIDMADLFEAKPEEEDSILQLVASFVEFKDFGGSQPRSILKQWRLRRSTKEELEEIGLVVNPNAPDWLVKQGPTRAFDAALVSTIRTLPGVDGYHLYAVVLKTSGKVPAARTEAPIGTVRVLDLELDDDLNFEETPVPCPRSCLGESAPSVVASSPNRALLAVGSPSRMEHLTFIRLPQRRPSSSDANPHLKGIPLAENLVLARARNTEASDVFLAFWRSFNGEPGGEAAAVEELLQEVWSILNPKPARKYEQERGGVATSSAEIGDNATIDWQLMGLTLGLYRACPNRDVSDRWVAANTMIRLQVIREAFADLAPLLANPLQVPQTAMNQLVGLTNEAVELTESLLREVIIWEAWRECGSGIKQEGDDTEGPIPAFILLALVHRHTAKLYQDVLNSIMKFGQRLVLTNNASRRMVIGMLGESKTDFKMLMETHNALHEKCVTQIQALPRALWFFRFSTFSLSVPPELIPVLNTITEGLSEKPGLIHKMSLLVPSLEYPILDSEEKKAALQAAKLRHPGRPATAASPLGKICLRCGAERSVKLHDLMSYTLYGAFERHSRFQCHCGGRWLMTTTT